VHGSHTVYSSKNGHNLPTFALFLKEGLQFATAQIQIVHERKSATKKNKKRRGRVAFKSKASAEF